MLSAVEFDRVSKAVSKGPGLEKDHVDLVKREYQNSWENCRFRKNGRMEKVLKRRPSRVSVKCCNRTLPQLVDTWKNEGIHRS